MRHEIDDECVCSDGDAINDDSSSNGSMFSMAMMRAILMSQKQQPSTTAAVKDPSQR